MRSIVQLEIGTYLNSNHNILPIKISSVFSFNVFIVITFDNPFPSFESIFNVFLTRDDGVLVLLCFFTTWTFPFYAHLA